MVARERLVELLRHLPAREGEARQTLRATDRVVCVDRGRAVDDGPFDALRLGGSDTFRRLAGECAAESPRVKDGSRATHQSDS